MNPPDYRHEPLGRFSAMRELSPGTLTGYHKQAARHEEITGARSVVIALTAGAALMYSARVMDVVSPYFAST
jgi:hypothetical protein